MSSFEESKEKIEERLKDWFESGHYCPINEREMTLEEMVEEHYDLCNLCLFRSILANIKVITQSKVNDSVSQIKLKRKQENGDGREFG